MTGSQRDMRELGTRDIRDLGTRDMRDLGSPHSLNSGYFVTVETSLELFVISGFTSVSGCWYVD